jgi:hypothetical protein
MVLPPRKWTMKNENENENLPKSETENGRREDVGGWTDRLAGNLSFFGRNHRSILCSQRSQR